MSTKNKLSLTLRPAMIHECLVVAEEYNKFKDWSQVREEVLGNNLLQARTESTLKTIYGEVSKRLKNLTDAELALMNYSESDAQHLVWLAICREYLFTRQFAVEVLSGYFDKSRFQLYSEDYDAFLNAKAEWHENLDNITQKSRYKSQQIMFKMLVECGLATKNKEILHQNLSPQVKAVIVEKNPDDLAIFPGEYH
ncbi:DUF1819 family protein [Shewanella sp. ULN5]|uniref:DUF1819 family protein n=1 Tax=Shewanella sp. ULN5 TaxID=2994678 RepID=UPI00273ED9F6|nr:DUF1819 family protein [Shewanella sp. ULN5]MDP5148136.1 DUF1819 family protein [Shewanella sp. ULN5]